MGRQLRLDEDIQGFSDEQLQALIVLAGLSLLRPPAGWEEAGLDAKDRELVIARLAIFRKEQRRREALVRR
jgi:hypothetical protein